MSSIRIMMTVVLITTGLAVWSQAENVGAVDPLFIKVTLIPNGSDKIDIEDFPSEDTHSEVKVFDYEGGSVTWHSILRRGSENDVPSGLG